jgi:hypothetical protein
VNLCREVLSAVFVLVEEYFQYLQEILDASLRTFFGLESGRDALCTESGLDSAALVVPDLATQITSGSKKKVICNALLCKYEIPNIEFRTKIIYIFTTLPSRYSVGQPQSAPRSK